MLVVGRIRSSRAGFDSLYLMMTAMRGSVVPELLWCRCFPYGLGAPGYLSLRSSLGHMVLGLAPYMEGSKTSGSLFEVLIIRMVVYEGSFSGPLFMEAPTASVPRLASRVLDFRIVLPLQFCIFRKVAPAVGESTRLATFWRRLETDGQHFIKARI